MMARRHDQLVDVGLSQNCWIVILENIKPKHPEFFLKLMGVTFTWIGCVPVAKLTNMGNQKV
jgi:hypothetical protein